MCQLRRTLNSAQSFRQKKTREHIQAQGSWYSEEIAFPRHSTFIPLKLLSRIFRPFYCVDKKSSEAQLQDDFGDFPPAPLRCETLAGEFNVIRTRGIGEVYHELAVYKKLIQTIDLDTQAISPEAVDFLDPDLVLTLRRTLDSLGRGSRFVKPALITLALGMMGIVLLVRGTLSSNSRPRGLGVFVPMFKDESNIIIKAGRFKHKSDAATISHEHIHLLQHRNPESHSQHVRCPQVLLSEKALTEPFYLYLLEKKEVEARLHESVLSFYRTHRQLPETVPGFLGLLAASHQLGWLVNGTLVPLGVTFNREVSTYPERETMFVEQLEFVLLAIKSPELLCKFLTEVLTVMYGNLLRYYGDDTASRSLLMGIKRPNFYDDLYGT